MRFDAPFRDWLGKNSFTLLAPPVALLLLALFQQTRLAQQLEYLTVSLRFEVRAPYDPPADPRLVLVGIDQKSIDQAGAWPWPRNVEADFLKTIVNAGANPHTVAFDLLFTDDYDKFHNLKTASGENFDQTLADAAGQLPSVITGALSLAPEANAGSEKSAEEQTLAELAAPSLTAPLSHVRGSVSAVVGSDTAIFPIRPLRAQSLFGFVNDEPSPIDRVRHAIPLLVRVRDRLYPSLALQILCQTLAIDPDGVEADITGGVVRLKNSSGKRWEIPIDGRGEYTINYRRGTGFRGVSFITLFGALASHAATGSALPPEADLHNKVLLVGQTATGLTDLGSTPLQTNSPLVYTHLNVINNVLRQDYLHRAAWPWVAAAWLALTWATLFGLRQGAVFYSVAVPLAVAALYAIAVFAVFWWCSLEIALVWPVLGYLGVNFGASALRWREEQRGREQLKQLFSRMLSPEVLTYLLDHPSNLELGGSLRGVTILFSDIRDYTRFSEGLSTQELVRQLNIYFERMVDGVKEQRGTFHKFIGDAIMAAWGDISAVSLGAEGDARNAVRSALVMRRKLRELNAERAAEGQIPLRIGMGINHGEVLVGQIGASIRSEFTVMGDPVNVASRLEGLTKAFHTDLCIGESVLPLLGGQFLVRRLGLIQLKGKSQPAVVYEVFAEKSRAEESAWTEPEIALYEAAFTAFLDRRFAAAERGFLACLEAHPQDYCSTRYSEACRAFLQEPPPPDWDGRVVMDAK
jgi:adenylate cyclase